MTDETPPRILRPRVKRTLIVVAVFALVLNVAAVIKLTRTSWSPLGPYPVQTVHLDKQTISVPTVTALPNAVAVYPTLVVRGDVWIDITVSGEKCSSQTVAITSDYGWRNIEPPGETVQVQVGGSATRLEGCTQFRFVNAVPERARQRVRDLAKSGTVLTLWAISGQETPVRDEGIGVPQPWTTETFAIKWEP